MAEALRSEDYLRRTDTVAGWPVRIVTYRIGNRHYCHIDNVPPGAAVPRAEGTSCRKAEGAALSKPTERWEKTRRRACFGSGGGALLAPKAGLGKNTG